MMISRLVTRHTARSIARRSVPIRPFHASLLVRQEGQEDNRGSKEWSGVSGEQFVKDNLEEVVIEITEENFEAFVIEQSKKSPVLLSCYADWCVPCQRLGKVLRSVTTDSAGTFRLGTMDIDKNEDMAIDLNVTSVPTVILYKGGQQIDKFLGYRDRAAVEEFLKEHEVEVKKAE